LGCWRFLPTRCNVLVRSRLYISDTGSDHLRHAGAACEGASVTARARRDILISDDHRAECVGVAVERPAPAVCDAKGIAAW